MESMKPGTVVKHDWRRETHLWQQVEESSWGKWPLSINQKKIGGKNNHEDIEEYYKQKEKQV